MLGCLLRIRQASHTCADTRAVTLQMVGAKRVIQLSNIARTGNKTCSLYANRKDCRSGRQFLPVPWRTGEARCCKTYTLNYQQISHLQFPTFLNDDLRLSCLANLRLLRYQMAPQSIRCSLIPARDMTDILHQGYSCAGRVVIAEGNYDSTVWRVPCRICSVVEDLIPVWIIKRDQA